ncbi:MAG: hypothetical protein Q8L97_09170 [Nitrosomonas sp.]|uniref:hypothetical protein n=1 Tax=Nitrosomonas sp. TaxID=42353 RepID=UPI0027307E6D|nr:hypothetical protein [Nitrosomonas sp.]MDP1550315.1 hypothetical protein [Nitrosomonas sp.]
MLKHLHPVVIALLTQILTIVLVGFFIVSQSAIVLNLLEWSLVQGLLSGLISYSMRMPAWWIPIHLAFIPLAITTLALNISSTWFLVLFLCLLLIYGKTYKTQVPLYLSSKRVNHALDALLPEQGKFSFVDLGSGCGGLVKNLANTHRNGIFHGIESAPLPFLISKLRSLFCVSTHKVFWGDFWEYDFSKYDVVYAYLSPVPMESLWHKAVKEMRPGSLLISNTFMIPGITPYKSIQLDDFSKSTLYLWKI